MLHIVWMILKILLLLLAVLFGLLLLAAVLILFVPMRYQGEAFFRDRLSARGKVTWLLHILTVSGEYEKEGSRFTVRVLGYPVLGEKTSGKKQERKKAAKKEVPEEKPEEEALKEDIWEEFSIEEDFPEEKTLTDHLEETEKIEEPFRPEDEEEAGAKEPLETVKKQAARKKKGHSFRSPFEGLRAFGKRILESGKRTLKNLETAKSKLDNYQRLWYDNHTQCAYRHIKKQLGCLFRHSRPRRLSGEILFGTGDPASTGQLLGIFYVLQSFAGGRFSVEADFERRILKGELCAKGHIRAWHFLRAALSVLLNEHCRITWKRWKKRS